MSTGMVSQDAVDELPGTASVANAPAAADGRSPEINVYDFRHPHRISKERFRALSAMYERLVRSLEVWLMNRIRGPVELQMETVEQLSFSEFTFALPATCNTYIYDIRDSGGHQVVIDIGRDCAAVLVDRFFGGSGEPILPDRGLTPIERMAVRALSDRAAHLLGEIWEEYTTLELSLGSFETIPEIIRAAGGDIPVLVATVRMQIVGVEGHLLISLPLSAIDAFLLDGRARHLESTAGSDEERALNHKRAETLLRQARVPISVRLPEFRIGMRDLATVRVGTTLDTGIRRDRPVEVNMRDQTRFVGTTGRANGNLAVTLTEATKPSSNSRGVRPSTPSRKRS